MINSFPKHCGVWLMMCAVFMFLTACGGGESSGDDPNVLSVQKIAFTNASVTTETVFANGQSNMAASSVFHLQLSHVLDEKFLNTSNVVVHDMNGHRAEKSTVTFDATTRKLTIEPTSLKYDSHYMIQLLETIVSTGGHKFSGNPEFSFFTEAKPAIFSQDPQANETEVSTRASVRIEFDNPMNQATINNSSFYLKVAGDINSTPIPANPIKFIDNAAILTPSTQLAGNLTRYTAVLTNTVLEQSGQPFSSNGLAWSFQTRQNPSSTVQFGTPGNEEIHDFVFSQPQGGIASFFAVGRTTSQMGLATNAGEDDAFIVKFDANHNQQWAKQIGTPTVDAFTHVAVDELGQAVYALGHTNGSIDNLAPAATRADVIIVKFNANDGAEQWRTQISNPDSHELSHGIVVRNGKVYIAGSTAGALPGFTNAGEHDYFIAELNDQGLGAINWQQQFGGEGNDSITSMGMDANGNLILGVDSEIRKGEIFGPPQRGIVLYGYTPGQTGASLAWQHPLSLEGLEYHQDGLVIVDNDIYISGNRYVMFLEGPPVDDSIFQKEGPFVAQFTALPNSITPVFDKTLPHVGGNVTQAIQVDAQRNIFIAGFIEGGFFFPPGLGPIPPPPGPSSGMKINVQKYNADASVQEWEKGIESTSHASVSQIQINELGGSIHLMGTVHGGGVDGNTWLGEGDGFLGKLNLITGDPQ